MYAILHKGAMHSLIGFIGPWLRLVKLPVCLMVSFSAVFGVAATGAADVSRMVVVGAGMVLLTCGSAAWNSLKEIRLDASMTRTQDRPLPRGHIRVGGALLLALVFIAGGLAVLMFAVPSIPAACVGGVAVVLYNLVYTSLKTRTLFALVPGAISGALPPYIGWLAAGGDPVSESALLLFFLFVLWQIPHTLLIHMNHKDDYLTHDVPSLIKILPDPSLRRIFLAWVGAFLALVFLLGSMAVGLTFGVRLLVHSSAVVSFVVFCLQILRKRSLNPGLLFVQLNAYLLLIMIVIVGERFF